MRIGILGGGLSGIALQHFLDSESEVLEKENTLGGLCRTFSKEGFHYDIGGHMLFSKDKETVDLFKKILGENINCQKRNSKVFFKGRYVKYPFENGLAVLDKEDIYDCLIGCLKNDYPVPSNFGEWIYYTFGKGIAEQYLIPYNKKIWKTPLEDMSLQWVDRVPKPPLEDIVKSALGIDTEGYTHQLNFNYPASGGIEALIKSLLKEGAETITGFNITRIIKKGAGWLVSGSGNDKHYDKLIITFPVKEALKCLEGVPAKVSAAAAALRHNSVRVVLIGVNNESLLDKTSIYIPSDDTVVHRVCQMGCFSRNNVPPGKSSLIAEVTAGKGHEFYKISDGLLIEKITGELDRIGIINKKDVIANDAKFFEYGYIVYDLQYQKNIKIIRDYFGDLGIELHGRFAEFEYINMDEVMRRSVRFSEKLNRK